MIVVSNDPGGGGSTRKWDEDKFIVISYTKILQLKDGKALFDDFI